MTHQPDHPKLDRLFVDVAYGPGTRTGSILAQLFLAALICWWHERGAFAALGLNILCGIAAGAIDRGAAMRHWDRIAPLTLRDVIVKGRQNVLPRQSSLRLLLPLIGLVAGAAALFALSPRPVWMKIFATPMLYAGFTLGSDILLAIARPHGAAKAG